MLKSPPKFILEPAVPPAPPRPPNLPRHIRTLPSIDSKVGHTPSYSCPPKE